MALTVTDVDKVPTPLTGGLKMRIVTLSESAYPTGGSVLTPAMLGLSTIVSARVHPAGGRVFEFDYTNNKVKGYVGAGAASALAEIANTTNISGAPTRGVFIGT